MTREIVNSDKAPKAVGPYSQAVKACNLLFMSGQIPLHPETNEIIVGGVAAQTERVLQNMGAVLEAAGLTYASVVKTTVFLKNMSDFAAMNEVYAKYFPGAPPARSTVEVSRLPKDVTV